MDYFKPLRRKIGVVTLLLFVALFGYCMRCLFQEQSFHHTTWRAEAWYVRINHQRINVQMLDRSSEIALDVNIEWFFVIVPLMVISIVLFGEPREKKPAPKI